MNVNQPPLQIELNAFAAMPAALADGHALQKAGSPLRVFTIDQNGVGDNEVDFSALARIPLGGIATQRFHRILSELPPAHPWNWTKNIYEAA